MKHTTHFKRRTLQLASAVLCILAPAAWADAAQEAGVEVLTRGPVHEAFAEAAMSGATASAVIDRAPYADIEELPPDHRPDGNDVAWIPGYWSWDDDRSDFIWLSGVWRDLPPGRQWVPGYWTTSQGGHQWISGFWGAADQSEVDYHSAPPESLEAGPSSPSPGPDTVWAPGCWIWQQTRYDWQPGYWVPQQPDWVWSPAHYTWTPRGHIYIPGYWDYDLGHRGVIFAPVYYAQPIYRRPSYYYSPTVIIDLGVIVSSLFIQTRSRHYYYGDYYDSSYESRGFRPWYDQREHRYGGDPLYMQFRARQLDLDRNWDAHVDEQFHHRRDHIEARPPQTFALQVNIINNRAAGDTRNVAVGRNLEDVVAGPNPRERFVPLNMEERKVIETRGNSVRNLQSERARLETTPAPRDRAGADRPSRLSLPVSPVAARPAIQGESKRVPPPRPDAATPQPSPDRRGLDKPARIDTRLPVPDPQRSPRKTPPVVKQNTARGPARSEPVLEVPSRVEPAPGSAPGRRSTPKVTESPAPRTSPDRAAAPRVVEAPAPAPPRAKEEVTPPRPRPTPPTSTSPGAERRVASPKQSSLEAAPRQPKARAKAPRTWNRSLEKKQQ